jgi:hypothetical protein
MDDALSLLVFTILACLLALALWLLARAASALEKLNRIIDSGVPTFQLKEERCPRCKADNPIGWRHCGKCGREAPYGYSCTDCGQPASEEQRYCTYCGRKFEGKEG